MAHLADEYYPFDSGPGSAVLEDAWRVMARDWLTSGPVRGDLSSGDASTTAGRNIIVGAMSFWIQGQIGIWNTATTIAFATNTSGSSRTDTVVVRNDFTANTIVLDVLQNSTTLTKNTALWEEELYRVTIPSGYTAIDFVGGPTTALITDTRRFAQGRPPGGPTVLTAAGSTSLCSMTNGAWTPITLDDADEYDSAAMHTSPGSTIVIPVAGLWTFSCTARWGANATGIRSLRLVNVPTALKEFGPIQPTATDFAFTQGHYEDTFAVGDHVRWEGFHNITGGGILNITAARVTCRYLGLVN